MRQLTSIFLATALGCGSGLFALPAGQASPNTQDVPHQSPGTNNPDMQKQRKPANPNSQKSGSPESDPTQNNPDVPHQEPGTDNPDVSKQRQPTPAPPNERGNTNNQGSSSTANNSKKKSKHKKQSSGDTHGQAGSTK